MSAGIPTESPANLLEREGLALIPVALAMTDSSQPINHGLGGPWLAAITQIPNSIGALTLVAIIPPPLKLLGIAPAFAAAVLLAIEPEERT